MVKTSTQHLQRNGFRPLLSIDGKLAFPPTARLFSRPISRALQHRPVRAVIDRLGG
jgi:hypothetical protein